VRYFRSLPIKEGRRLGPYEIVSRLGAGGMGEVWKGRDTRLERSVAIKVLPAEFAQNAELKARLEREAKTVSQLNHPHICTLHDFGVDGDTSYLVMELVEGETLADRLARGPLPLAEVLRYGAQIADALDRAHRAHIVHRDLKPGNVMITRTGVKLLDFGLAKAAPLLHTQHDKTTVINQRPLTAEGSVVGTLQYMSPEQLGGDGVDHRTDIFALGAVLYEMATGRRAFTGSNNTSLIAAILSGDPPPMSELQPLAPASFEHIVAKCLAKDPESRWQSAYDIAEELRWIAQQPSGSMKTVVAPTPKRLRSAVPWLIAAAAIAIASVASWRAHNVSAPRVTKTILSAAIENAWNMAPVFSPDGRRVAYPAEGALWIRTLDDLEPRKVPLAGMRQSVLFWSPDGKWLAYVSEEKLWKIAPGGNAPVLIAPLPRSSRFFHAGAWGADDRIILAQFKGGLFEISARGGSATEFLPADPELVDFHSLCFLPDGKRFLAVPHKLTNMATVELIDGTKRKTIINFGQSVVRGVSYSSATGHLLVSLGGLNAGVWAVPLSAESGAATGKQFLVAAAGGGCSASADGSLVYVANVDDAPRQLVRIDRSGKIVARIGEPAATTNSPVVSHDEKTIAYSSHEGNFESIGLFDIATGTHRRLTSPLANDAPRAWSHDDRYLLADRSPSLDWNDSAYGLWRVPVDGSGEPSKIAKAAPSSWASFTSDDRNVVFLTFAVRDASNIASVPVTGGNATEIVKSPFPKTDLTISPDGHFIAYTTRESGSDEVVATRYPEGQGRWPVSRGPGSRPVWSRDGHSIYFVADNKLFSAPVSYPPSSMTVGEPVVVFDALPLDLSLNNARYDVFRDGSIITTQDLPPSKRQVVLVQNWLEEFR